MDIFIFSLLHIQFISHIKGGCQHFFADFGKKQKINLHRQTRFAPTVLPSSLFTLHSSLFSLPFFCPGQKNTCPGIGAGVLDITVFFGRKSELIAHDAELFSGGNDALHLMAAPLANHAGFAVPAGDLLALAALHETVGAAIGAAGIFVGCVKIALNAGLVEALAFCLLSFYFESPGSPPVAVAHFLDSYAVDLVCVIASEQQNICFHLMFFSYI